jgi:hypothetical protein
MTSAALPGLRCGCLSKLPQAISSRQPHRGRLRQQPRPAPEGPACRPRRRRRARTCKTRREPVRRRRAACRTGPWWRGHRPETSACRLRPGHDGSHVGCERLRDVLTVVADTLPTGSRSATPIAPAALGSTGNVPPSSHACISHGSPPTHCRVLTPRSSRPGRATCRRPDHSSGPGTRAWQAPDRRSRQRRARRTPALRHPAPGHSVR